MAAVRTFLIVFAAKSASGALIAGYTSIRIRRFDPKGKSMCEDLQKLYQFAQTTGIVSPVDVVRVACNSCGHLDVCSAVTEDEYDGRQLVQLDVIGPATMEATT